jgi:hypothetical protein
MISFVKPEGIHPLRLDRHAVHPGVHPAVRPAHLHLAVLRAGAVVEAEAAVVEEAAAVEVADHHEFRESRKKND